MILEFLILQYILCYNFLCETNVICNMTLMKLSYFLTLFSYNNLIYYFLNLLRLLFRFPRYVDSTFLTLVNKKKKKRIDTCSTRCNNCQHADQTILSPIPGSTRPIDSSRNAECTMKTNMINQYVMRMHFTCMRACVRMYVRVCVCVYMMPGRSTLRQEVLTPYCWSTRSK